MPTFSEIIGSSLGLFPGLVANIFNTVLGAAIILLIGVIAGRLLGKFTQRLLQELGLNKLFRVATGIRLSIEELLGNILSYFIYFIALVMSLNHLGLDVFIFNMVAAGIIILVILSISLALKDFMPNFFAGLYIRQKRMLKANDFITLKDVEGVVERVELIETKIRDKSGDLIHIPNSAILKSEFVKIKKSN